MRHPPLFGIKRFLLVFLASIFLSLHYATTLYVNSSYLGQHFSSGEISIIYVLGALVNILFFLGIPKLMKRASRRTLFLWFLTIQAVSTAGLAVSSSGMMKAGFFVFFVATIPIIYYLLDLFLEDVSLNSKTGEIRGLYLTFMNASIAAGPLLASTFTNGEVLSPVYVVALALLAPVFVFFLAFPSLGAFRHMPQATSYLPFRNWISRPDIRRVTLARLVLNIFYALMVIFTPLYLKQIIGFSWGEIGLIFTIMLLPFIIFEWPMGELGDRYWGEKEIMTLGFFIMGTALIIMPFLDKSLVAWAVVLFFSRVGASWAEISTESYFFKKVESEDSGLISIFRLTGPASTIIGALIGGILVTFLPFNILFFFIALIVLLGMKESLFIHDTL